MASLLGPEQSKPDANPARLVEDSESCPQSGGNEDAQHGGRPPTLVARHKYRDEIIELLAAGWSPRTLNQMLGRLHPDYEPIAPRTLNWYRQNRIRKDMMRPLEEYQRRLRDEHVLLDPVRERAVLILLQEGRVQKAIDLEQQLESVILPAVGQEIERLAKLWDGYEQALGRMGMVSGPDGHVTVNASTVQHQVNIYEILAEQVSVLPPEMRQQLAEILERIRDERAKARIAAVDARVRAMMPESPADGTGAEEGEVVTVIEPPSPPDSDKAGGSG